MVPHKVKAGNVALERLKAFEGIPPPYDKVKRLVVPDALKVLRLQHGHKYCRLGDLAQSVSGGDCARKQRQLTPWRPCLLRTACLVASHWHPRRHACSGPLASRQLAVHGTAPDAHAAAGA